MYSHSPTCMGGSGLVLWASVDGTGVDGTQCGQNLVWTEPGVDRTRCGQNPVWTEPGLGEQAGIEGRLCVATETGNALGVCECVYREDLQYCVVRGGQCSPDTCSLPYTHTHQYH
ncbi:unnamed protein product [Lota lota]